MAGQRKNAATRPDRRANTEEPEGGGCRESGRDKVADVGDRDDISHRQRDEAEDQAGIRGLASGLDRSRTIARELQGSQCRDQEGACHREHARGVAGIVVKRYSEAGSEKAKADCHHREAREGLAVVQFP